MIKKLSVLFIGLISLCFTGVVFADASDTTIIDYDTMAITSKIDDLSMNKDITTRNIEDFITDNLISDVKLINEFKSKGSLTTMASKDDYLLLTYKVKTGSYLDVFDGSVYTNKYVECHVGKDNADKLVAAFKLAQHNHKANMNHHIVHGIALGCVFFCSFFIATLVIVKVRQYRKYIWG